MTMLSFGVLSLLPRCNPSSICILRRGLNDTEALNSYHDCVESQNELKDCQTPVYVLLLLGCLLFSISVASMTDSST